VAQTMPLGSSSVIEMRSMTRYSVAKSKHSGLPLISRTHLKRPILAVEERHAKKKNVLGGVQT
jgi:hypothetical protein